MYFLLIALLLSLYTTFALENLGVYGQIYRIEERSILEEIKKKASKQTISYKDIERAISKASTIDIELPVSKTLNVRKHKVIYTVPQDVYIGGRLIAKKGDRINVLKKVKLHRIYVVLNDYMIPQFLDFARRYPNTVFLIAKGNIYELDKKYKDHKFYGALPQVIKALRVRAVPSIVYQREDLLYVVEVPWSEGKALLPF